MFILLILIELLINFNLILCEKYSTISIKYINNDKNLLYVKCTNICIKPKLLLFYSLNENEYNKFLEIKNIRYSEFMHNYNTSFIEKNIWKNNNTWIITSAINRHITHFIDNRILLWYLSNNNYNIDYIIDPLYNERSEYDFSNFIYYQLLKRFNNNINLITSDDYNKLTKRTYLMCFNEVKLIVPVVYIGLMSWFINLKERNKFRDYILSNNNLKYEYTKYNELIKVSILYRNIKKRSRNIIDYEILIKMLNDIYKNKIIIKIISFDDIDPIDQIKLIMNENIIISPHGASLTHLLWVNNNCVIIECFPYIFLRPDIIRISITSGVKYFPHIPLKRLYSKEHYNKNIKECIGNRSYCNGFDFNKACDFYATNEDDIIISYKRILFYFKIAYHYIKYRL